MGQPSGTGKKKDGIHLSRVILCLTNFQQVFTGTGENSIALVAPPKVGSLDGGSMQSVYWSTDKRDGLETQKVVPPVHYSL